MFSKGNFSHFLVFFTIMLSLSGRFPNSFPLLFTGLKPPSILNIIFLVPLTMLTTKQKVCEQIGATD